MSNRPSKSLVRKTATILLEVALLGIIIGLLVGTWLPAMIGANPDRQPPVVARHR